MRIKKRAGSPDYLIIFCIAFLVIFGLVMLASASSYLGQTKFGDSYYYLKHQLIYGFGIGLFGFIATSIIYYRRYEKLAIFMLIASIGLLTLVFTPLGLSSGGADRWIKIGPVNFQPSEILKITFIIYLAAWLGKNIERAKSFTSGFIPFLIVSAIIAGLLIKQPATSTVAILMVTGLVIYFISGARLSYILGAIITGALTLAMVIYITPYRFNRIITFLNPETDLQASGYHINQAKIAIGSGGLLGVGYGESTTKIRYLPEPIGDSIFAIIAEELGFIGAMSVILVFLTLIFRTFWLARKISDKFGQLILVGFGTLIALQTFVNIGAISGILPLTGTPLPFISFGGTALAVFMIIGGIIVNISKHR